MNEAFDAATPFFPLVSELAALILALLVVAADRPPTWVSRIRSHISPARVELRKALAASAD